MSSDQNKMDKNSFRILSFTEKNNRAEYWRKKTSQDRLAAAWYLICCAYNIEFHGKHRIDKTQFKIRTWDE